jgi:hypothetical protein
MVRPAPFKARVNAAITAVTGKAPTVPFSPQSPGWTVYHKVLIGVALDASGPVVVKQLPGFIWP